MPWTIERLRLAIVAAAVLLLLTIVGSFFYGRWRLRRIAQDLPARLGLQIQQSTQGFVLSKTEQGRSLFTLHAARAVEFKSGGHVSLHDVRIDLYNRQDGKADTIAGNDFEYDPHSQIVEAKGEAHILLHAPATSAVRGAAGKDGAQVIRATTHGLVFNQKTGVATCSGEVDFQMAESSGQAIGVEYDSKQGLLRLDSQIVLTTTMQNHPAVLRASKAIYDRNESQLHLWQPRYSSGTQSGTAGAATVFLRANGSAERLDAQDRVRLASGDGMVVRAPVMHALLNGSNRPQQAHFSGGVEFTIDQPTQKSSGSSRDAEIDFDSQGRAHQVALDRDVQFLQNADAGISHLQRTLTSNHLLLDLLPSKTAQSQLKSAVATGNAVFTSQSAVAGHAPEKTTLAAQNLKANFAAGNQLQQIDGAGQTRLQTIAANGDVDSSTGDVLHIEFAQGPTAKRDAAVRARSTNHPAANENSPLAAQSIQSAVQTGHVVLQQTASGKGKNAPGPRISTATAARADYVAANDTLTLTGDAVFRDAQLEMRAHRMELNRTTGKMVSTGAVQVTLQPDQQDGRGQPRSGTGALLDAKYPIHVIAQQATIMHDTGKVVFSGRARLWQGDDTIEAPIIEVSQKAGTLVAYGDKSCLQCVISNFTGGAVVSAQQPGPKQTASATPSTFRVISQRLVYSDAERKASFLHHVQVFSSSGVLFAEDADIFLSPASRTEKTKNSLASSNNGPQSSVTRIVATGDVRLLQPGRSATGSRLVYTQEDGHFVLTGDEKNPPEVIDLDHGTATGQVLTFASREQAIMVSGAPGHTTTTKTRVQKK